MVFYPDIQLDKSFKSIILLRKKATKGSSQSNIVKNELLIDVVFEVPGKIVCQCSVKNQ